MTTTNGGGGDRHPGGDSWPQAPPVETAFDDWPYNRRMDYQLVIKFWRGSLADEAFLATIEGDLKQALGDAVELDGYDVNKKEINLFIVTSDPKQTFRRAKDVLERLGLMKGVSSAYRLVGGARFTSLWPLRSTRKFTLP